MSSKPKWVSKVVSDSGSVSCTKVTEVVVETDRFWLVQTEGWRGQTMVRKNGKGEIKPWSKQPWGREWK